MDLYQLTRKLVARGCPEHEEVDWYEGLGGDMLPRLLEARHYVSSGMSTNEHRAQISMTTARAIWTMHALEWCRDSAELRFMRFMDTPDGWCQVRKIELSEADCWGNAEWSPRYSDTALEAIEAATRHLESAKAP